ncbi:MAG: endonuclease [Planctomycetota bacterium]|nr:MAG: endonuclease [Planctomycetota bacterium]
MKVLTCNIRVAGANDGENNWEHRKEFCAELIRSQKPDIICFQEMQLNQFEYLSLAFPAFQHYGMCDEPIGRDPRNAIFYLKDNYKSVSSGGYWLSETPHIPGTKSWNSNCVRIANWVVLEELASGKEIRVVNTHLDHIGQEARENQARIISEDALAYPEEYPQVLTGDMNCDTTNKTIDNFKVGGWVDTYGVVHGNEAPGFTFHKFEGSDHQPELDKMDWIFTKGDVKTIDAVILKDSNDGRYPSDHYFVSAVIEL